MLDGELREVEGRVGILQLRVRDAIPWQLRVGVVVERGDCLAPRDRGARVRIVSEGVPVAILMVDAACAIDDTQHMIELGDHLPRFIVARPQGLHCEVGPQHVAEGSGAQHGDAMQ